MTEVLKWVGIVSAGWFAVAVMVAVAWHRARKNQPRIVRRDGQPISQREVDAIREIAALDAELRGRGDR